MPRFNFPTFPHQPGLPPTWRGRPPHLVEPERELWYDALDQKLIAPEAVWFDVPMDGVPDHVTEQPHYVKNDNPALVRAWYFLNARRCDAIGERGDRFTVYEMRALAGPKTVGELAIYRSLSLAEWPGLKWDPITLITRKIEPTTEQPLKDLGVVVIRVAPRVRAEPGERVPPRQVAAGKSNR